MQNLRNHRSGLRLAALIALLALIGGCSSTAEKAPAPSSASSASAPKISDTSQTSATSSDEPSTSESSSANSATADTPSPSKTSGPIYFNTKSSSNADTNFMGASYTWNGGLFAVKPPNPKVANFAWQIGLQEFSHCSPELLKENEIPVDNNEYDSKPESNQMSTWATTDSNPQAYYAFAAKEEASGLKPESLHAYIQPINLKDCSLGERVDMIGTDVPADAILNPKFIASTDDTLVVSLFDGDAYPRIVPNLPAVMGYNVKTKAITWKKTISAKKYSASSTNTSSVFSLQITESDNKYISTIAAAKDGSTIAESSGINYYTDALEYNNVAPLGDGKIYYTASDFSKKTQAFIFDGTRSTPVIGGQFETAIRGLDAKGESILVGIYSDDSGKNTLGSLGSDGVFAPILTAEQTSGLDVQLLGVGSGRVFIETTAERVVVGLDGKQIGDGYSEDDQPYIPLTQQKIGSDIYTVWGYKQDPLNVPQFPVAITKSEMTPPSSTPGE